MRRSLLLVTILLWALTACTPASTSVTSPNAASATVAATNSIDLRGSILTALAALKDKSYRQQSETVLADGTRHTTVIEYAAPNKYHIVADSTTELILIGQQVYLKQGDVWSKSDIPAASIIDPNLDTQLANTISDIQFGGTESLNNLPMQVYSYNSLTKIGGADTPNQSQVWIGTADGLPYKMIIAGETAALNSQSGQAAGVKSTTTSTYEYDPAIKIEAPIQ